MSARYATKINMKKFLIRQPHIFPTSGTSYRRHHQAQEARIFLTI